LTEGIPALTPQMVQRTAHEMRNQGRPEIAATLGKRALAMAPDDPLIVAQIGNILATCEPGHTAVKLCQKAREMDVSREFSCRHNEALVHINAGDINEAVRLLEVAVGGQPDHLGARWDLALARLPSGDWAKGWEEAEVRFLRPPWDKGLVKTPRWRGKRIDGQTLWVHAEQGVGDILQFSRYLGWAASRCRRLVLSVPPCLLPLFRGYPAVAELYAWSGEVGAPEPRADWSCPIMSLPLYHGTTPDTVPRDPGWLGREPPSGAPRLMLPQPSAGELKVGLCWAGNPTHGNDRHRSIAIERLFPLAENPRVQLYSFQVGPRREDLARSGLGHVTFDVGGHLTAWEFTAMLLKQLDLLITVDTGIAHLAGILGVKTALLLPRNADWRWMREREDTPWYPSMALFRQRTLGDWNGPISGMNDFVRSLRSRGPSRFRIVRRGVLGPSPSKPNGSS
jgi:hypothetical protein